MVSASVIRPTRCVFCQPQVTLSGLCEQQRSVALRSVTVLITRPEPQAQRFAEAVRGRLGKAVPLVLSPLMRIDPEGTAPDLSGIATLIFTSRHGVEAFARLSLRRDLPCYAVGDATARAARGAGLRAVSCRGDAAALVARMRTDAVPGPCLHLHGAHVAADLAAQLSAAGIATRAQVLYRQQAQGANAAARRLLSGTGPVLVPLFSPRSAKILAENAAGPAPLFVAALSANVADALPGGVAHRVAVAAQPDAATLLDLLPGLYDAAKRLEGRGGRQ